MPRAAKPKQKPALRESDLDAIQDGDLNPEMESEVEDFFTDLPDEAVVSVYRIGKPGERDGFLDQLFMSTIRASGAPTILRDTYGPGQYRLRLRAPNRNGKLEYRGSRVIAIADRMKPVNGASTPNGSPAPDQFMQQMILTLIAAQKPQSFDMQGFAALIAAVNGGQQKQSDLSQVVSAFTALKQNAEPPDVMTQMEKAISLARSINGPAPAAPGEPGEADTSWPGLIKGALQAFTGGPRQPAITAGNGADEEYEDMIPENPGNAQMNMLQMQRWLGAQLQFLKIKAQAGKAVEPWIAYCKENGDEPGNQAIHAAINGGATFENLLQFDPEIAQNPALRVWFQRFYVGIKNELLPNASGGWTSGYPTNPGGNAGAGAAGQPQSPGSSDSGPTGNGSGS